MQLPMRILLATDIAPRAVPPLKTLLSRPDIRLLAARTADALENFSQEHLSAVIIVAGADVGADSQRHTRQLLSRARERPIGVVIVAPDDAAPAMADTFGGEGVVVLPWGADPDLLAGCMLGFGCVDPLLETVERENQTLRKLQQQVGRITQIDEEMRLAGRLQSEFMPRQLPEVNGSEFSVLFRPAGYVSGDIFDAARLDETHVGFYIADVMGHGMPAALLTMFIKRAMRMKEIFEGQYRVVPPNEVLRHLNAEICSQEFSGNHFATIAYCVVNTKTLVMQYARAGHPLPLKIGTSDVCPLGADGALLGIFPEEEFALETVQLRPGDHVLLYSDGFEFAFGDGSGSASADYLREFQQLRGLNTRQQFIALGDKLDRAAGSLNPRDDMTAVLFSTPGRVSEIAPALQRQMVDAA